MEVKTFDKVEDLFSASIDDLADLAAFETPPAGSYILSVTTDVKEINGKQAVEASFVVVETVELKDPAAKPVANGTKFSTAFMLNNEFGVGKLKDFLKPFATHYGNSNIGELIRDEIKDVTIACTVTNRKDKEDPDKIYGGVKNITVS